MENQFELDMKSVMPTLYQNLFLYLEMLQLVLILGMPTIGRIGYYKFHIWSFCTKIMSGVLMYVVGRHNPWLLMIFLSVERYIFVVFFLKVLIYLKLKFHRSKIFYFECIIF